MERAASEVRALIEEARTEVILGRLYAQRAASPVEREMFLEVSGLVERLGKALEETTCETHD